MEETLEETCDEVVFLGVPGKKGKDLEACLFEPERNSKGHSVVATVLIFLLGDLMFSPIS